jgi:hypothetical protein
MNREWRLGTAPDASKAIGARLRTLPPNEQAFWDTRQTWGSTRARARNRR